MTLSLFLTHKHTSPHPTYCQVNVSCPSAKCCQYVQEANIMGMLHWLFTALMANHRHSSWQPVAVLSFHSSNKRSDSAWHINNSSLKGKFSNLKCVCGGQIQCIGKRAGEKAIKRWQTASWKTSMNVVMNCDSRPVHAYIFSCPHTSGSVPHWLQRDLKPWAYPSWPIHPLDIYNLQDIGRGFPVSWGAGSVHTALWHRTYICGIMLDVFNHSLRCHNIYCTASAKLS